MYVYVCTCAYVYIWVCVLLTRLHILWVKEYINHFLILKQTLIQNMHVCRCTHIQTLFPETQNLNKEGTMADTAGIHPITLLPLCLVSASSLCFEWWCAWLQDSGGSMSPRQRCWVGILGNLLRSTYIAFSFPSSCFLPRVWICWIELWKSSWTMKELWGWIPWAMVKGKQT